MNFNHLPLKICYSSTLLENQEVQKDFNVCEKDSFHMNTEARYFSSFMPKHINCRYMLETPHNVHSHMF